MRLQETGKEVVSMAASSFRVRTTVPVNLTGIDLKHPPGRVLPKDEWQDAKLEEVRGLWMLVIPAKFGGLRLEQWRMRWERLIVEIQKPSARPGEWEDVEEKDFEMPGPVPA